MNLEVLPDIRVRDDAGGNGVARRPVQREVGPRAVRDALGLLGVERAAGFLVGAYCAALGAVVLLLGEVLCVRVAEDAVSFVLVFHPP